MNGPTLSERAKSALRALLPPLVLRGVRRLRGEWKPPTSREIDGRLFQHRGSEADAQVLRQVFDRGDYDLGRLRRHEEIARFYENCERPLILDCGANIGASALWFARQYPRARVVAVEPESNNFALLEENTAGWNVGPLLGAVAARPGRIQLFDPGQGEWGFRTSPGGHLLGDVRAYTIDELSGLEPDCTPFILKIDIEGAESEIFATPPESPYPVVIVELHDWMLPRSASSRSFLQWHASQNRDMIQMGENTVSLSNTLLPGG